MCTARRDGDQKADSRPEKDPVGASLVLLLSISLLCLQDLPLHAGMASVHLPPLNPSGSGVREPDESSRSSLRDAAEVDGVFSDVVGLPAVEFGVWFDFNVTY